MDSSKSYLEMLPTSGVQVAVAHASVMAERQEEEEEEEEEAEVEAVATGTQQQLPRRFCFGETAFETALKLLQFAPRGRVPGRSHCVDRWGQGKLRSKQSKAATKGIYLILLRAVLGKNGLGLTTPAYAPRALPGWVGGLDG